jgi:hypothetical protein
VTAHRKLVKEFDQRARDLGHVPRDVRVPEPKSSLVKLADGLARRTHVAMMRRIKSG